MNSENKVNICKCSEVGSEQIPIFYGRIYHGFITDSFETTGCHVYIYNHRSDIVQEEQGDGVIRSISVSTIIYIIIYQISICLPRGHLLSLQGK